jgi:sporulation protein YlmC with PRC-barrel domain
MKHNLNSLIGYTIGASDGEIGEVKEFYFDNETWTIRYIIVETGNWLSGRKCLITPHALLAPDWENRIFPVKLTREQIKNSPDIDTERPVSREEEIKLENYYMSTGFSGNGFYAGGEPMSMQQMIPGEGGQAAFSKPNENPHLRSSSKVTGYNIAAIDGEIGKVEDFLIHDGTWKIDFMVVDTGHWLPGKKVLIAPKWIREIDWETSTVVVKLSISKVKNSPEYHANRPLHEDDEIQLHNYYGEFVSHVQ